MCDGHRVTCLEARKLSCPYAKFDAKNAKETQRLGGIPPVLIHQVRIKPTEQPPNVCIAKFHDRVVALLLSYGERALDCFRSTGGYTRSEQVQEPS